MVGNEEVCPLCQGATAAEVVYVYIFGDDVTHLHVHLAPHHSGDALNNQMIRGQLVSERLEGDSQLLRRSRQRRCQPQRGLVLSLYQPGR